MRRERVNLISINKKINEIFLAHHLWNEINDRVGECNADVSLVFCAVLYVN